MSEKTTTLHDCTVDETAGGAETTGAVEAAAEAFHQVTIDYGEDGCASTSLSCQAPADAYCRTEWSCDCEEIYGYEVVSDVPQHLAADDVVHEGEWSGGCSIAEWFDNCDEPMRGKVTVPVRAEWGNGGFQFHLLGGAA